MDHQSIMTVLTMLELAMERAIWRIMMSLATMMEVIAALMLIELEMASVMKKTRLKSATLMIWTAVKTGNQLVIEFAMLKTIMHTVILMQGIVVLTVGVEMVFVMMSIIILDVGHMMKVTAVLKNLLLTSVLIANAMKTPYHSEM